MKVVLERYHGLGNDYVVFDPNKNELELTPKNVKMICDRNEGLGSDGVLEGPILKEDGMHVKVWNPDGSESETSGNGVRIFAKYLKDASYVQKKNFKLYTAMGQWKLHSSMKTAAAFAYPWENCLFGAMISR